MSEKNSTETTRLSKQRKNLNSDVNLNTKKAYNQFIKETGKTDIPYEIFTLIPKLVHERMIEKLYSQSYFIKIPDLGVLKMFKVKPFRKYAVDWKRFSETKEIVKLRNTHTNGFLFKVHLYINYKKNPVMSCFSFYLARAHRRNLAKLIFNNKVK